MCCDVLVKRYLQWNQFWGYYFVLLIYLIRDFLSCSISAKKHFRIRRVCLFFFFPSLFPLGGMGRLGGRKCYSESLI